MKKKVTPDYYLGFMHGIIQAGNVVGMQPVKSKKQGDTLLKIQNEILDLIDKEFKHERS